MNCPQIFRYIVVLLALFAASVNSAVGQYEGYRHKGILYGESLPNGIRGFGGGLVEDENYGVARYSSGKIKMLWLEKMISRDERGVPSWEVKDVLMFERLPARSKFLLSYSSPCTMAGKADLNLVVMAEQKPRSKRLTVRRAWMVNLSSERFEEISVQNVTCE